jgi:hypothetical protein
MMTTMNDEDANDNDSPIGFLAAYDDYDATTVVDRLPTP